MNPPMNPLDTEIRRAMGELANAAPPPRPPESFGAESVGTEFEPLRTASASTTSQSERPRGWLLAAAATVIVAVAGVALVIVNSDRTPTSISGTPTVPTTPEIVPLAGDALVAEMADRRWVALERFDDPSPTARTPEFTVRSTPNGPVVTGFDGCNGYGGSFVLDGASIASGEITSETVGCGVDTLGFGGTIELLPGASTFLLSDADGAPLARFHDLDLLTPASAEDMPFTFFGDSLESVGFLVSGVGFTDCTRFSWEESADGVTVSFLETLDSCDADDVAIVGWLTDMTAGGANVFVTPTGLLLADASSTLHLLRPPTVEADPDGVTLAAGAIYGIEPGPGVSPDDVLTEIVPRLGPPDLDTGWVSQDQLTSDVMNPVFDPCGGTTGDYRELWWGDLSFGFWGSGSRTDLQFWNVGDRRLQFSPDTPGTAPTTATGLTTDVGVGIGDPVASIPDSFATAADWNVGQFNRFDPGPIVLVVSTVSANPAFTPGRGTAPSLRSGGYLVVDGTVVAFGSSPFTC